MSIRVLKFVDKGFKCFMRFEHKIYVLRYLMNHKLLKIRNFLLGACTE